MYERFSDKARKVIELSEQNAKRLNHEYVGTEHLLLGLIREEEGLAGQVLRVQGLTLEAVRDEIRSVLKPSKPPENEG